MLEKYLKKLHKKAKKKINIKKKKLKQLNISFELKSFRILGQYSQNTIYINEKLFNEIGPKKYFPILRHEYGHFLTDLLYKEVEAHGKEWKNIMYLLGDKNPSYRTGLLSKEIKEAYKDSFVDANCKCSTHKISVYKAGRIRNKTNKYYCTKCSSKIKLIQS
jgi:SprT protein